jgi:tartrate dehydrogenase/decarboxylase/D-malate dehydrogenase
VVRSNLFGDILSDMGPAATGPIGIAPSVNLNPEREFPSMFEPVRGSAPGIAGAVHRQSDRTNLVGAMMLDHLGEREAAAAMLGAIETVLVDGPRTRDIGGTAPAQEVDAAIAAAVGGGRRISGAGTVTARDESTRTRP